MNEQEEHEHWFFGHEDPRWLMCECGQYAARTRNIIGESDFRLIDPPHPVLALRPINRTLAGGPPSVDLREANLV